MKSDVVDLMRLRQQLARTQGYANYPELVFRTEELEPDEVRAVVSDYLEENLSVARNLARHYGLSWSTWFADLTTLGSVAGASEPQAMIVEILRHLGLQRLVGAVRIVVRDQPICGYAGILSVPDDVRILVRPVTSLPEQLTLYHELGHVIAHALNDEHGVYRTWTCVHDETMAEIGEWTAARIMLDDTQWETTRQLWILENTRLALSTLFELDLWEHPESAEALYQKHYGRYGLDLESPDIWAVDSFRSIDPVYTHNYVIGARVADHTLGHLRRQFGGDPRMWGDWLTRAYYADGRRRSLREKVATVGGWGTRPT
jgi:hypothetical protein